jgi:TRAP-type uncharacterized transport system fused permease subunit
VSCIGIMLLAAGLHGYLLRAMPHWQRGLAITAALFLVAPDYRADLIGFALTAAVLAIQFFGYGVARPASVGAAVVDGRRDPRA